MKLKVKTNQQIRGWISGNKIQSEGAEKNNVTRKLIQDSTQKHNSSYPKQHN